MVVEARDAFGRQLLDANQSGTTLCEILERDDHYIYAAPNFLHYFGGYNSWPKAEKEAIALAQGRVLDIGCGSGKHALFLQDRGLEVTAIDNSPGAVAVCRSRGLRDVHLMSIANLVSFGAASFDTVLFMGNTFGLLSDPKKGKRRLAILEKITVPNARLIATCQAPTSLMDTCTLQYGEYNRKRGRRLGNLRVRYRYKTILGEWFDYLLVEPQEVREVLLNTGWSVSTIVFESELHYVVVAEKR